MKVLIAVTHLLGSGHLARALTIARSFAAAGHDAVVASGGMGAPQLNATGVTLLQLPPLRPFDHYFLYDDRGFFKY